MGRKTSFSVVPLLLSTVLLNDPARSQSTAATQRAEESAKCDVNALPSDIRDPIKRDFASWKIQESSSLSEQARKTRDAKQLPGCPGIAVGLFQDSTLPSYAVLLVSASRPNAGYKLVVFSRTQDKPLYEPFEVEHSDASGGSNYFIRKVILTDFFSEESKKKFNAQAPEGILLADSTERGYRADLYFWSSGGWRHQPANN
jgi:hypothetical protein